MAIAFFLVTVYCVVQSIRRFAGKRPPLYIQKDPTIKPEQIAVWSRWNGYSLLFWAVCSLMVSAAMFFAAYKAHIIFYILAALAAAGGIYFAMRGSAALRNKVQGFKKTKGASKCGKQNKKRRNSRKYGK